MKEPNILRQRVDRDRQRFGSALRIFGRTNDDRYHVVIKNFGCLNPVPGGGLKKGLAKSPAEPAHYGLGFGISEPNVVFEAEGTALRHHDPGKESAAKFNPLEPHLAKDGETINASVSATKSLVTHAVGEYEPTPPVLGPWSPS